MTYTPQTHPVIAINLDDTLWQATFDDGSYIYPEPGQPFENAIKTIIGIYLNFIPSIVETFMRNEDGSAGLLDIKPDILEINEIDIDGRFRQYLDNVKIMSKISIEVDTPKKQTYVLHYRK